MKSDLVSFRSVMRRTSLESTAIRDAINHRRFPNRTGGPLEKSTWSRAEIKRWIDDEKAIALIYWENMEYSWLGGSRPAMSLHGYLPSNS